MKFNQEAKPLVPYLITFATSLYFLLNLTATVGIFSYTTFVRAIFSLFSLFGIIVISLLFLVSVFGILNYLGVTNVQVNIGKTNIKTYNEWLLFIFLGIYFITFLFEEILLGTVFRMFDWELLFNFILLIAIYIFYNIYVAKVEKEKTIIALDKFVKVENKTTEKKAKVVKTKPVENSYIEPEIIEEKDESIIIEEDKNTENDNNENPNE